MDFSPSLFGWHAPELPLGAGVAVALWLVWRCWRRTPFPGRASFIGMQLAAVWWTSAAAVENHVISPEAKLFWAKMAWIGIASAPGLWAMFVWSYTQGGARRGWFHALAVFALVSWAVGLTNDAHHLMYLSAVPATADAGAPLVYEHGAYFYMATTAIYVQMMASLVIVIMAVTRAPAAYRSHYLGFLAAMLIPWMANAGYLTGTLTLFGFDGTPFALIVMGCVFHWLVQRRRLFELVPVARGLLLDVSPDPVLGA
ncbi:histidine kinase N-terminal 7TM domain-containing protein [Azospirillum sp. SYSU D00513]|uniref:histidine kinase N-terminal 7TM domain-containing protein n=1 Tax=Azospirillum sp. SYSU D00513 TaxID=2812561 RepID=UPI001A969E4C|nr:histidine kinase N-terminal 7TM domain-containing protein [Azospirillum sp. SYSU D00513]